MNCAAGQSSISACPRHSRGFTLIELNVVIVISAVLLLAISAIFLALNNMWERTANRNRSEINMSEGISRMAVDMRNGVSCQVLTRFTTNDAVVITLPSSMIDAKNYGIQVYSNKLQYAPGAQKAYYLSDSSGSWSKNGNILWSGAASGSGASITVTPDTSSLWGGTSVGVVQPVQAIEIDPPGGSDPANLYTITITAPEVVSGVPGTTTLSRRVYLRNHQ